MSQNFNYSYPTGNYMLKVSSRREVFFKKNVLRNFTKFPGKHLCQSDFIKKETLAQVFFSEFCEISKNIFFNRKPPVAAFGITPQVNAGWAILTIRKLHPIHRLSHPAGHDGTVSLWL